MPTPKMVSAAALFAMALLLASAYGCNSKGNKRAPSGDANASSYTIGKFVPPTSDPSWTTMQVNMQRTDAATSALTPLYSQNDFHSPADTVTLVIPQGSYTIVLTFLDATGKVVYQTCDNAKSIIYQINTPKFANPIPVCMAGSKQVGSVDVKPASPTPGTQTSPGGTTQPTPSPQDPTTPTNPSNSTGACIGSAPHFGLPDRAIPGTSLQFAAGGGDLSQLPPLAKTASTAEIKAFVAAAYGIFPQFKQIFQDSLGLTREQTLAFFYADMSRESGKDGYWQIDLETAAPSSNPANAWGPFQAAVTNFKGFNFDSAITNATGLPVPQASDFKNAPVSTYAGMRRLAEGVLTSMQSRYFGLGQPASLYLLGTLADHNTGYPSAARDNNWAKDYGNEVLRLAQGYLQGSNLTNNKAFWTTQPAEQICN